MVARAPLFRVTDFSEHLRKSPTEFSAARSFFRGVGKLLCPARYVVGKIGSGISDLRRRIGDCGLPYQIGLEIPEVGA